MKKFAIGCLIVFVILGGIVGVLGYQFVVKPSMKLAAEVQELSDLESLNSNITNTTSFTIPESNELTDTQVSDFMTSIKFIGEDLQDEYEILKNNSIFSDDPEDMSNANFFDIIKDITGMSQQMITIIKEGKLAEIKAINDIGYSLEEYNWIRERVIEAAGLDSYDFSIDQFTKLEEQSDSQILEFSDSSPIENIDLTNIPQKNIDLVQPYIDELSYFIDLTQFNFVEELPE